MCSAIIESPSISLEQANKATTEPELALDAPEATWQTATQSIDWASRKPLVYFGGGVVAAGAVTALRGWLAQEALPSVCTLKGIGVAFVGCPPSGDAGNARIPRGERGR